MSDKLESCAFCDKKPEKINSKYICCLSISDNIGNWNDKQMIIRVQQKMNDVYERTDIKKGVIHAR